MMSSTLKRFSSSSRLARPHHRAPASQLWFIRMWRPDRRFSSTVMWANSSMFWNVRAMPRSAVWLGLRPISERPFHVIFPCWGR